jgi:hypothetical protein
MGEDEIEEIFDRIKERLPSYDEAERELVRRLVDETISPIMVLPRNDEMDRVLDGILYCSKRLGTPIEQSAAEYSEWVIRLYSEKLEIETGEGATNVDYG